MFWNKKEIKETNAKEAEATVKVIEAKPEETALYKRIRKLYSRLEHLNHNGYYSSNLGNRKFKITKEYYYDPRFCYCQYRNDEYYKVCFTNEDVKIKETKYFNNICYEVENGENIFTLSVWEYKTKLEPCPINLSAHEIDLAILEFENYLDKVFKEHKAKIKELEG